ncbi:sugar ABC transporter substrate-binding protein [Blastococcus sp. SYSU D00820]
MATALVVTGCSSGSENSGDDGGSGDGAIALAGVLANTSDPFWASIACGAQEEAEARGVELDLYTSTSIDDNQTASNFQTATLKEPDGIFANPFNGNQFVAQYRTLMQSGVPVVTATGTEPRTEYQVVFSDADTAGFAEEVLATVPEGAGSMVYMGGAPGIPPLEARTTPLLEAIAEARPDLTRLEDEFSGFDINKATTDASSLIIANPDLRLIVAAAGPDAVGAAAAIEQAGKAGQITLIAFDAIPPEVEALRRGTITVLIAQNPFEIGRQQVGALVDYLEDADGGPVPTTAEPIGIPQRVLTAETVDDPENADYVYRAEC